MQRNLNIVLLQMDGTPFKKAGPTGEPTGDDLTLGNACFMAVSGALKGDEGLDLNAKMRLYGLAELSYKGGTVELSAEDVATLKERTSRLFSNFVLIGRIIRALETDPL